MRSWVIVMGVLLASGASAQTLSGSPTITDGDTLKVAGKTVRLHGIDAPEGNQQCVRADGEYLCGRSSTEALMRLVGKSEIDCEQRDVDRYRRIVGVCRVGKTNLNSEMVRLGWARAYTQYSRDYVGQESEARAAKRGIWQGPHTAPWDWRKERRKG